MPAPLMTPKTKMSKHPIEEFTKVFRNDGSKAVLSTDFAHLITEEDGGAS